MKVTTRSNRRGSKNILGFTLIETMMAIGVSGLMLGAFFSGAAQNTMVVQATRESLRASQIMTEKMDTLRLYSWTQINTPGFVVTNFTAVFDPVAPVSQAKVNGNTGSTDYSVTYKGTVTIKPADVTESYASTLREVTITLNWQSGRFARQAQMKTFVSQYGIQSYVY